MTLTTPLALAGLLTLPVILALHMFRERSRRTVVSSLSLWQFMEIEVRGSRIRRIPITWLLILDLLIAALLSLALANPTLARPTPVEEARHLLILLDRSTSMAAQDRFSQAQRDIGEQLAGLGSGDMATVITFGSFPEIIADSRELDLDSMARALAELVPGQTGAELASALALAEASRDATLSPEIHIYTDAAWLQEPDMASGSALPIVWHTYGSPVPNQAVLSIAASPLGDQKLQIFARFANFGSQPVSRVATLLVNGSPANSIQIDLGPDSTLGYTWDVFMASTPSHATVVLEGGDALSQDDAASIGLTRPDSLRVALVSESPDPLVRAIQASPNVDLTVLRPEEYVPGSAYDLVVFRGYLPPRWPGGSVLVFEPPAGSPILASQGLTAIRTLPVPRPDPLLADIDFSGVRWTQAWEIDPLPPGLEPVYTAGDLPLIARGQVGLTRLSLLLPDLNSGNFTRHPAFPVLMANALMLAADTSLPAQIRSGQPLPLPAGQRYPSIRVQTPDGEPIRFAVPRPADWRSTLLPGPYHLELTDLNGASTTFTVGVNAGDPEESNLLLQSPLPGSAGPFTPGTSQQQDLSLQPWLLALAALLMIMEAWFAWRR